MLTEDNGVGFQGASEADRKKYALASRLYECKKCGFLRKTGDKTKGIQMQEIEALYMVSTKDWSKVTAAPANNFFSSKPTGQPNAPKVINNQPEIVKAEIKANTEENKYPNTEKAEIEGNKVNRIQHNPPAAQLDFKVVNEQPIGLPNQNRGGGKKKKDGKCSLI